MSSDEGSVAPAGHGYGATLWEPDAETVRNARISHYMRWLADRGIQAGNPGAPAGPGSAAPAAVYQRLWEWSVANPGEFWTSIWDYFDVLGDRGDGPALTGTTMPDVHWFPDATLNYARNALRTAWTDPDRPAIIAVSERRGTAELSYAELAAEVARVARGLRALGVTKGDRVVALLPNIPEAVIGLLAAASIGAIWSSCSPDFGTRSVVDRFAQIEPAVLLAVDGYTYNGKDYPRTGVVAEIAGQLPTLKAVVMVGLLGTADANPPELPAGVQRLGWAALGDGAQGTKGEPEFEEVPFEHPLWVVYSSGTTGLPKPIVHGHGGIVLEHLKALALHMDLKPGDRFTWYTTTGWMMWNFLAGGLLAGTTIAVYDGSATFPATDRLWRLAADERLSYLGAGAPYLMACQKADLTPKDDYDLSQLRGIGSTGSPLPPEAFTWVYDKVKETVQLGSLSGGTDVCTGFVGSCPLLPVRSGVISGRSLGADVQAFDEHGHAVIGQVGELVLTTPMPSMPVRFWNDTGRQEIPGQLLRGVPRRVAARRLDRDPARRRLRHLRPLRRDAQQGRRADGHQRVLPRRRVVPRGRRQPGGGHRPARRRRQAGAVHPAGARPRARRRPHKPGEGRAQAAAVTPARPRRGGHGARRAADPVGKEAGDPGAKDFAGHTGRASR